MKYPSFEDSEHHSFYGISKQTFDAIVEGYRATPEGWVPPSDEAIAFVVD